MSMFQSLEGSRTLVYANIPSVQAWSKNLLCLSCTCTSMGQCLYLMICLIIARHEAIDDAVQCDYHNEIVICQAMSMRTS